MTDAFHAPLRYVRGNHDVGAAWTSSERTARSSDCPFASGRVTSPSSISCSVEVSTPIPNGNASPFGPDNVNYGETISAPKRVWRCMTSRSPAVMAYPRT